MKKRSICYRCWAILLICFILCGCFGEGVSVLAAAVVAKGEAGGIVWELDTDGVLSFDGTGELAGYGSADTVPWHAYRGQVKKVVFHMGSVSGGDISYYFSGCQNLQSVNNIPEGVQKMDEAFLGCENLTSVGSIPETMQSLCRGFKDCICLNQEIRIPGQAVEVKGAFDGCQALTYTPVIEGEQITDMSEMFRGTAISAVPYIPEAVKDLSYTFANCKSLRSAPKLPRSLENMDHTFYACSRMTTASDVPANVKTMSYCYYGCVVLAAAPVITSNVLENMEYAFYNCRSMQTSPRAPESVRNMSYTFYNCGNMQSAPDVGPNVKKMSGCFAKCGQVSGTMTVYAVIQDKADYDKFAGDTAKYAPYDNPNFLGGDGSGLKVNYINNNKSQILNYLAEGWNNGALRNDKSIGSLRLGIMGSQNVASCEITKPETVVYNGSAFTPEPEVYYAGIRLKKEEDYTLTYQNNKNAGTATVSILGQGEYDGNTSVRFVIQKAPLKSVKAYEYSGIYDGKAHAVTVVCDEGATIEYGVQEGQYTLEESPEYVLPGIYTVYFRVKKANYETYTGSTAVTIESAKLNVDSAGFSGEYDGNPHSIRVSADEGAVIRYGTSPGKYDMTTPPAYINAGTYTVYYEVTKTGYATFTGKRLVIIQKKETEADDVKTDDTKTEKPEKGQEDKRGDENNLLGSLGDEITLEDLLSSGELLSNEELLSGDVQENTIASFIKNLDERKSLNTIKGKTPQRPGKVKIKKLRLAKGNIKVVWKKAKSAMGYQVVCSRKKSGTGSTKQKYTKKKQIGIRWKKQGKCYVKVRAYTVYKGRKVYGAWSRVHKLNTSSPKARK
ncbi:MAG: leucine-rich repeat domain-containing protein [Roseburia sp.]|nr:leucine-rich repeat domain-containing protein [Roseburia sp.]